MGPPAAEAVLRECLALGADRAVLVTGREFGGADTLPTSYVIAKAALQLGSYDMIFCRQGDPGRGHGADGQSAGGALSAPARSPPCPL